jgi:hypothetical protein
MTICQQCRDSEHDQCVDTQAAEARRYRSCLCQHKVKVVQEDAKSGESFEG